jgi:hypothetical protein
MDLVDYCNFTHTLDCANVNLVGNRRFLSENFPDLYFTHYALRVLVFYFLGKNVAVRALFGADGATYLARDEDINVVVGLAGFVKLVSFRDSFLNKENFVLLDHAATSFSKLRSVPHQEINFHFPLRQLCISNQFLVYF